MRIVLTSNGATDLWAACWQGHDDVVSYLFAQPNVAIHCPRSDPEGITTIRQLAPFGGGADSWKEWGVDKAKVTSLTIPLSVTNIGHRAFDGCHVLANIDVPHPGTTHLKWQDWRSMLPSSICLSSTTPLSKRRL